MEPTYTVLGTDGNQYGPVSAEELRGWMREGRIANATQVWRSDRSDWVAASTFPELAGSGQAGSMSLPVGASPSVHAQAPVAADPELARRVKSGAGWFYWIAAFTIINAVMVNTGSRWGFALGLAAPQLFSGGGSAIGIVINALAAGFLVFLGVFAGKGQAWAFILGMVVMLLDSALTGLLQMWLSLIIHAFALFSIFSGFRANRQLQAQLP
jgi:hypothetical protein